MSWTTDQHEKIEAAAGDALLRIIALLLVQVSCDIESLEKAVIENA